MSQGDLSSDRGGQSPATSDLASAFATGLVLGGGRDDDDDDVYFGDEEETEFTNGLGGTSCNDDDDSEDGLLTGGGGGGGGGGADDDDSDDDMFSKTYTSDRGSTFERHDSMQSAQSEAVKLYAEEKGLGSGKTSFRAALLKKRQTRHNANNDASMNSATTTPAGLNNKNTSTSAGAAFNRLREQQQLQAHQQQIHQLRHAAGGAGIDGVHAASLLAGGGVQRASSLSGISNVSSNTSSRVAVASGLSPHSTTGSQQQQQRHTVTGARHQNFPSHPAALHHQHINNLSYPTSGAESNSTTPASISPRQEVLPGTPLTLISTADGASPRGAQQQQQQQQQQHPQLSMTAIIDNQNAGGFRVAVAATAGPGEDSESDEEATLVDALTGPLIDNNMAMIADLLRREGAPPILQQDVITSSNLDTTLSTMGVQDRHLNFRSCAFEGEDYDAFYNHHQSCIREGGCGGGATYKPLSLSSLPISSTQSPDRSHHHLSSGSPSPVSDNLVFGGAQVLPGVVPLQQQQQQLRSPTQPQDPHAHHHIRSSSQDNQTRGNEQLQSTMQCPPSSSFPPKSTVVVGCTLKQLRRVQGPLHYTPLFASLFAVGSGGMAPRGTVIRHTGDYTLVRFKNLPTVNVAPISTHSHLHLADSIRGCGGSAVYPQRGLWPHLDSTYHPLNTVLTPRQRSELMDNLDEEPALDRTRSIHPDFHGSVHNNHHHTDDDDDDISDRSPIQHHHSSSTNKYPAMLSKAQQHVFMEGWSTNRDQRQRLRSEIVRRTANIANSTKGSSSSGGGATHHTTNTSHDDSGSSVTCEFTIHRSCLSLLSSSTPIA